MSFEPTIIIKKTDLDKYSNDFDKYWEWKSEDEKRVMEYLKYVYEKHDVVKIDDVELVICSPEFSTFNRLVREKLSDWGVQYGISN